MIFFKYGAIWTKLSPFGYWPWDQGSSKESLNVGKAKVDQHQTSAARKLCLQKQFGYHDGKLGHTPMSATGAHLKDDKIDHFSEKSRFES